MTSPVSLPAGSRITAASLDAYENATNVWQSYTPVWSATTTNPTLGDGTLTGVFRQVGKTVDVRIVLTVGSASTVGSGTYSFSLPAAPKIGSLLNVQFKDLSAGTARYAGNVELINAVATGSNMRMVVGGGPGTVVSSTAPVVPASGDQIIVCGTYEAA